MRIVDAHHHLWDRDLHPYPWLAKPVQSPAIGDTTPLCRNYLLADFLADARGLDLAKSVHLQAEIAPELAVEETRWLQSIADTPGSRGFPHAIVAFADLAAPDVDRVLEAHGEFANMRGIRQILNRHSDPALNAASADYLNDPAWQQGYARLAKHGYSFDLQLYWPQMADAAALAKRHPDIPVILNHTGMPRERDPKGIEGWRQGLRQLAQCPNVTAKISGLGMVDHHWTEATIRPFVLDTIDIFDPTRCLFASNFPVDRLYSDYATIWQAFDNITKDFSANERAALFHDNAVRVYRL